MHKNSRPVVFLLVAAIFCGVTIQRCASTRSVSATSRPDAALSFAGREPTVLVCPIDCVTSEEDFSNLALTLAPLIRRDLFCVQQISVIPTADTYIPVKAFFLTANGLRRLGAAHGADVVVVGLLRGNADNVSIELGVFDVKTDYFVLRTKAEGKKSEIFKLQRQLVYQFIDSLEISPSKEEHKRIKSSSPKKLKAAKEYGQGLRNEQKEKYAEALIAYDNAVTADRQLAAPYAAEARIYNKYNAPLRAMESYENAVARDNFFAEAWYQLSLYAAQYAQNDVLALECCKKAVEIAPRFGKARLSLGTRLHDLGHLSQAIEETKAAASLLPTHPLPRYNLGLYYLEAGERDEARTWFERALELDPDYERARIELQKLGSG